MRNSARLKGSRRERVDKVCHVKSVDPESWAVGQYSVTHILRLAGESD